MAEERASTGNTIGRIGEHLVCVDLLRRGLDVAFNSLPYSQADVIGYLVQQDQYLRVQVKTTVSPDANGLYDFTLCQAGAARYDRIDLFAFVALDSGAILYETPDAFLAGRFRRKRYGARRFNEVADQSFRSCLEKILNGAKRSSAGTGPAGQDMELQVPAV